MSFSDTSKSHDYLLLADQSDGSAFGEFVRPSSAAGGDTNNDIYENSIVPPLGYIDPFIVDEADLEGYPTSLCTRLYNSLCSCPLIKRRKLTSRYRRRDRRCWDIYHFRRRPRPLKLVFFLIIGYLSIVGLIQVIESALQGLAPYFPDDIEWILDHWGHAGEPTEGFAPWPTDATADVLPVNCHSHNDYWRRVPLYAAIYAGCTGAEADVWLANEELYVGHRRLSLTAKRTLQNLYLNPLLELLEKQNPSPRLRPDEDYPLDPDERLPLNGVFDTNPTQQFVLLIDFKSSGPALWWKLDSQLAPLREKGFLTHFNGSAVIQRPVTIVGTGNAPFDRLTANETYRDVFFDAPLEDLADLSEVWPNPNRAQDPSRGHQPTVSESPSAEGSAKHSVSINHKRALYPPSPDHGQGKSGISGVVDPDTYNQFNSYYASVSFTKSIGRIWGSRLTQDQLQLVRSQIRGAHQRGLKVRYWGLPQWPMGLRNHVWHVLMREGVDILNVDDLKGATRSDWRRRRSWGS